ncbi:MAG: hypothetical protein GY795_08440 [Desulfobacterales bacterium]|nr:hypothetical protein [Desulfobacterales bacterium]
MKKNRQWAIETIVPDEIYTDRQEHIDYFYNAALKAITRRTMSTVLLGQRRMGKTEIFKRVVNRLFSEQDHKDPDALVPVFYEFPDEVVSRKDFALRYVGNFIRWYAAFRLGDIRILSTYEEVHELIDFVEEHLDISDGLQVAIDFVKAIARDGVIPIPEQNAVKLPREVAAIDDSTVVMFLDEFQNTRLPHHNFSITGFFQTAVESPRCPHFVTGSAMSILSDELLGKGALYGRFHYRRISAFTDYYGKELATRTAQYYGAEIPELMAPVVSDRCGGNPFYITALVRQAAEQNMAVDNEEVLNEMLAVDITSGFIWAELSDQVNKWIDRVNEHGITKWILYLSALEQGDEIDPKRIKTELKRYEYTDVPIQKIKEIMIKLARGDLLEYKSFGNWFCKINDPILNEFLKVWGEIEVERQNHGLTEDKTVKKFRVIQKRFHEYKGYLAEVYMIQILWNGRRQKLPGKFFHSPEDIVIPRHFSYIDQRHRPGTGQKREVDIYAAAGKEVWLAESKWWNNRPVGPDVVENLLRQAEVVREREGEYLETLRLWIFAHDGVTEKAEKMIHENGILWSARDDLDGLLEAVGLRKLPKFDDDEI